MPKSCACELYVTENSTHFVIDVNECTPQTTRCNMPPFFWGKFFTESKKNLFAPLPMNDPQRVKVGEHLTKLRQNPHSLRLLLSILYNI